MINYLKSICIIILFPALLINTCQAQSKQEVLKYRNAFNAHQHTETYTYAKKINNEVDAVFSGLFLTYKYLISSQDVSSCVFYPSCSVYGILSIQKHGIIIGGMATFDRLSRCNPLSPENYSFSNDSNLLYDPVD